MTIGYSGTALVFRARRKALGYSQGQLARIMGMTVASIQGWEHGRRAIRPSVWAHLLLIEERARQYHDRPDPEPRPSISEEVALGLHVRGDIE